MGYCRRIPVQTALANLAMDTKNLINKFRPSLFTTVCDRVTYTTLLPLTTVHLRHVTRLPFTFNVTLSQLHSLHRIFVRY